MTTINIDTITYVKDHYEIVYIVDGKAYQTQFKAVKGRVDVPTLKSKIEQAYILKETGIVWGNIAPIDYEEPVPPTPEQQAISNKHAEVDLARNLKDQLSNELDTAYFYVEKMNAIDAANGIEVDSTVVATSKQQLKAYIDEKLSAFNTAYADYATKKAELDALVNA